MWPSRWLQPKLQVSPSQIHIISEAIKVAAHVLSEEPLQGGRRLGGAEHDGKRNANEREE